MNRLTAMFMPHPPILLSEIGQGKEYLVLDTLNGMKQLAKKVVDIKPETIIYISPHGNSFSNGTAILFEEQLSGDLTDFGNQSIRFTKNNYLELAKTLSMRLEEIDILNILLDKNTAQKYKVKVKLDHGILVPMYFIDQEYSDYKVVCMTPGFTDKDENYRIGQLLSELIKESDEKVLVVCSGDLSHALKDDGPYHYHKDSKVFDQTVVDAIKDYNPLSLLVLDEQLIENAAQCGLNSFLIGLGLFDKRKVQTSLMSYEGPFGVGYLTGCINEDYNHGEVVTSPLETYYHNRTIEFKKHLDKEDKYIKLARLVIEQYIRTGTRPAIIDINEYLGEQFVNELLNQRKGTFVSIHKRGQLRGCIGTISASLDNLLEEIIHCAISASSHDPRFDPINAYELNELDIKVDILSESESISSIDKLDVIVYGIIVESGDKRGVLLPNLEGVNTIEEQIKIAKQKAGIFGEETFEMRRFKVVRHEVK